MKGKDLVYHLLSRRTLLVFILSFLIIIVISMRNRMLGSDGWVYSELTRLVGQSLMWSSDRENETNHTRSDRMQLTNLQNCDSECRLLQSLLLQWPKEKRKALIYLLVRIENPSRILGLLEVLDKHFNKVFRYPVVIFHENHRSAGETRSRIKRQFKSMVYFQTVEFKIPHFLPSNLTQLSCDWNIGYRHMCRFHAKLIYEQAIIRGFEYAWRLDDDSQILRPIEYDVFQYMHEHDFQYGYTIGDDDAPRCTVNLWESAALYITKNLINVTFFDSWKKNRIYYNNFEISRLSLWLSDDYQNFIDYIDRLGGIYYYRWGDAPIKTIAVTMFVPRNQTHHFKDIGYSHQGISTKE